MTKLHSAISPVINTQHELRSIMQPATPVVCTGQHGEGERKAGGPDYQANSKSAIQRQIVSTSFLKLNLRINNRIVFALYNHRIDVPQVNTAYGSACSHMRSSFCASYNILTVSITLELIVQFLTVDVLL